MTRAVILLVTYVCAVLVACVVSAAFFFGTVSMLLSLGVDGSRLPYACCVVLPVMGFCGVFSGSFCLERTSRRFGSLFLLFLGLAYFTHFVYFLKYREGDFTGHPNFWIVQFAALAVGGLVAVALVFWRFSSAEITHQKSAAGN